MSTPIYDVVIIGGGMSGLMASHYLTHKGFRIALISRGDPVCCLSTGCIDVLKHTPNPLKSIKKLPEEHPYHRIGEKNITEALDFFMEIMKGTDIPYIGSIKKNREILTPIGTTKTTCLVPQTMEYADIKPNDYIHIISFKGIKDFYPSYITSQLKNTSFSVFDAQTTSTLSIATRFEDKAFLNEFISWLQELEIPDGKVGIPAVLGINNPVRILEEIKTGTGKEIFEIPTLPPSIPGLRLFRALKKSLQKKHGQMYWGKPVSSVELQDSLVEAVTLSTSGRHYRVQGRAFILATGSFVSGGLYASRDSVKELVFNLPVYVPGQRQDWFNTNFFNTGHAIEAAGIITDASFKPAESKLDNLFVCGSILAHSQIMKNHCGHGLAIATGIEAAKMCERQLS